MVDIKALTKRTKKLIENTTPQEFQKWLINHRKMTITHDNEVYREYIKVDLLELASELAVSVYGAEHDTEHIEYFKRLIKKHEC